MSLLSREVWGPALWTVLHTLAERSGGFTNNVQILDEELAWIGVFRYLQDCMPCPLCASHYKDFVKSVDIQNIKALQGLDRRQNLKLFWWTLHNQVNERNGKEKFPFEQLSQYNDRTNFKAAHELLRNMVKRGVEQNQLHLLQTRHAFKFLDKLGRYYGLL